VKARAGGILVVLALSLFLGLSAAFPWALSGSHEAGGALETTGTLGKGLGGSAIAFVVLFLMFAVLPRRLTLPMQILAAMVLGVFAGRVLPALGFEVLVTDYFGIFGTLFILLLKLVIIPLIFVSIVCGVAGIGDARKLGSVGAKALGFYFCTTAIAVLIGLTCVNVLRPGVGHESLRETVAQTSDEGSATTQDEAAAPVSLGMRIQRDLLPTIIQNPIMAGQNPLVIIFFLLLVDTL